ncbi:MAG: DUF4185 domain-containing protein, partial [Blastocatellia bacterium]
NTFLRIALVLALAILGIGLSISHIKTANAAANQPPDLFLETDFNALQDAQADITVTRVRPVKLNLAILTDARETITTNKDARPVMRLNLFPDVSLPLQISRIESMPNGEVYVGEIIGAPGSHVRLSVVRGQMSGAVTTPEVFYQIEPAGDGLHRIEQLDQSRFPVEAQPLVPETEPNTPESPAPVDAPGDGDDGSVIDVMVVYTTTAREAAGGRDAIEALINRGVSETNTAYENSRVVQRLRLVHAAEVDYAESQNGSTDLGRLRSTTDGFMDNVHALRETYGADEVTLIVNAASGICGIGYLMTQNTPTFAPSAFNVVVRSCFAGNYSFGHELGHNMGLHHDRDNAGGGRGVYPFSYGYRQPEGKFRTVMAYPGCPAPCPRILNFSNPDVSVEQAATGIPGGIAGEADNARTLNDTRISVAAFRTSKTAPACAYQIATVDPPGSVAGAVIDYRGLARMRVGVTTTAGCVWEVINTAPWIRVLSALRGVGSGEVSLEIEANPGAERATTLNIAGRDYTIRQGAAPPPTPAPTPTPTPTPTPPPQGSELGPLTHPASVVARIGAISTSVGARAIWIFPDTFIDNQPWRTGHSTAAETNIGNPLRVAEAAGFIPRLFIPFTSDEQEINTAYPGYYIGLSPRSAVDAGNGEALVFYEKRRVLNIYDYEPQGVGLARVRADNPTAAARDNRLLFTAFEPRYGAIAIVRDTTLYVYSSRMMEGHAWLQVARVPLARAGERAAWEFWNGAVWQADFNQAQTTWGYSAQTPSISWNEALGKYLAVYFADGTNQIEYRTAAHPAGPWSAAGILNETQQSTGSEARNYGATLHPVFSMDGGRTLTISYQQPTGAGYGYFTTTRLLRLAAPADTTEN